MQQLDVIGKEEAERKEVQEKIARGENPNQNDKIKLFQTLYPYKSDDPEDLSFEANEIVRYGVTHYHPCPAHVVVTRRHARGSGDGAQAPCAHTSAHSNAAVPAARDGLGARGRMGGGSGGGRGRLEGWWWWRVVSQARARRSRQTLLCSLLTGAAHFPRNNGRVWDWEDDWFEGENQDGSAKGCFPSKLLQRD